MGVPEGPPRETVKGREPQVRDALDRRVHFQKGRNRILLRCENGHWNVGWSLCIATGDGLSEL